MARRGKDPRDDRPKDKNERFRAIGPGLFLGRPSDMFLIIEIIRDSIIIMEDGVIRCPNSIREDIVIPIGIIAVGELQFASPATGYF